LKYNLVSQKPRIRFIVFPLFFRIPRVFFLLPVGADEKNSVLLYMVPHIALGKLLFSEKEE
jgi:hypothetical protein